MNIKKIFLFFIAAIWCGPHERRLINDLMANYRTLERPVANESDAVVLKFGLTLQQIMDVVSVNPLFGRREMEIFTKSSCCKLANQK